MPLPQSADVGQLSPSSALDSGCRQLTRLTVKLVLSRIYFYMYFKQIVQLKCLKYGKIVQQVLIATRNFYIFDRCLLTPAFQNNVYQCAQVEKSSPYYVAAGISRFVQSQPLSANVIKPLSCAVTSPLFPIYSFVFFVILGYLSTFFQ